MREGSVLTEYAAFVGANRTLSPCIERIPLPRQENSFQYVGGQIFEGKLYGVVNSAESMLVCDLKSGEITFRGRFAKTDFKWSGGCIWERTVVFFPRAADCLLLYHIDTDTFEEIAIPFSYAGEHHSA